MHGQSIFYSIYLGRIQVEFAHAPSTRLEEIKPTWHTIAAYKTYLIGRSTMSISLLCCTRSPVSLARTVKVVCLSYGIPMLPPLPRRLRRRAGLHVIA